MRRKSVVDRRQYPELGLYYELLLVEYDHEVEGLGDAEPFRYKILEESDYTENTGGIRRDIRHLVIETSTALPFKEGDRVELNEEDMINYFGTTSNKRVITEVEFLKDKHYNKIKAKYPNRKIDITVKRLQLK